MAIRSGELGAGVTGRPVPRRTVLRAAAVAGALAAAALPTLALADKNDNPGRHLAKGHHKRGRVDVTGTTAGGAAFAGQIRFLNFQAVQGTPNKLMAKGVLSGTFKDASGKAIATLDEAPFTTQVTDINPTAGAAQANAVTAQQIAPPAGCTILNLVLGPLQLDLLGLVLTIPDAVTIDLTAVPGGGLLGDLLCAVANLLSGGLGGLLGNLTALLALANALNDLFDALNNL
jgi:hypothetical protein